MSKTALFFSPEGGSVQKVSEELEALIGADKVDVIPVGKVEKADLAKYDQIIFIGSTVGADHWSNETIVDEWQIFFTKIGDTKLKGIKTAIIGLGNSVLYPEHFADGMAHLHRELEARDAEIYGSVDSSGYTFEDSEALNDEGIFCGLPLDEDNEDEQTPGRLEHWITQLQADFAF